MNSMIETYKSIYQKVEDINAQIDGKTAELSKLSAEGNARFPERIENLETTLEKVDDYLLRVKGFQELAKKNLESTNVLTIEAPPGYRVNLNRLRNWAMLIDPTSSNDPYAQRVYVVAKCDECFLEQKKVEFTQKLEALKNADASSFSEELLRLQAEIEQLDAQLLDYSNSGEIQQFAQEVIRANEQYWIQEAPEVYSPDTTKDAFAPGAVMMPFRMHKDAHELIKAQFGKFYDENGRRLLLPFELPYAKDFVMMVACYPSRTKQIDKGIQNILLNYINSHCAGENNIYVLDAARFNSSSLGSLRAIEGSVLLNRIPRNPEQLTNTLEKIVSDFSDYDDVIELADSVREYNENSENAATTLPTSLLVLYGWPNSFSKEDRELIKKIMMNYERYGLSVITVSLTMNDQDILKLKETVPEYAANNAISVVMKAKETTITEPEKKPRNFTWYTFNAELKPEFVRVVKEYKVASNKKGNEYTTWFSLEEKDLPEYTREYKQLSLPFGMDAKENIHNLSFENENFAAYLVGASRSGKSTLLHTLIAGIIRNYHPDNVELWLADFKQLEFKRYMDHLPPHVKYVLLDESNELVFDLVDRLTDEMLERQKLFSRLGKQRIDQIDATKLEKPLPLIFVILDEFSIMSQSIAESPIYKLKLQNLLAKGAALGIRFLFSSQTFTTGVSGLSSTARAQIQQRISMKGAREEISETLELSTSLKTEQVKNWMDALPPHYALVKFRTGPDTPPQVKRFLVMYFEDYGVRDQMIDNINRLMKKKQDYCPNDNTAYVDKHPVLVDGNSFDKYDQEELLTSIHEYIEAEKGELSGEEVYISFGTPRLMSRIKLTTVTNETRENILLVARSKEQQCAVSIILSAIKSFQTQKGKVEIWAYSKNAIFKEFHALFKYLGVTIVTDIDDVCDSIRDLKKKIQEKENANTLIVLVGMDRICMDFDFVDNSVSQTAQEKVSFAQQRQNLLNSAAAVHTDEDEILHEYAKAWQKQRTLLKDRFKKEGKTKEEIKALLFKSQKEFKEEYFAQQEYSAPPVPVNADKTREDDNSTKSAGESEQPAQTGAYNAQDDFLYVVKQGSRLGYHFMLCINDYSDLKQCGFKRADVFRYRMAFQLSVQDSRDMFDNKYASELPEHICKYDDRLESYTFRPYLHQGVEWDGWYVHDDGTVFNPYSKIDDE